jgi:putative transposase
VKIAGKWHYLYRAIDGDGQLVDSMLRKTRDMDGVKRFCKSAKEGTGCQSARVTADGHNSYPQAIRVVLGRKVQQRTNRYLKHLIEQDHRGVKQRYYFAAPRMSSAITIERALKQRKR